ncbi:NlpC/P60 family protein [Kitasatospora sp. NPDC058965]|uniref:C40 family peptidase n=1 Tax=Kitasatospora sp. NPDC058965 TaxID=3346682 RepID=UPI00368E84D9
MDRRASRRRAPWGSALALILTLTAGAPARADPAPVPVPDPPATAEALARTDAVAALLTDLQALRHRAEAAEQASTARDADLAARRGELGRADAQVDAGQQQVDASLAEAGRLAAEQYRGGGLSGIARLLFSFTPGGFFAAAGDEQERSRSEADVVAELRERRDRLADTQAAAQQAQRAAQAAADQARAAKQDAEQQAGRVAARLAALSAAELSALDEREGALAEQAQQRLLASGALGADGGPASTAAATAVAYALAQLGKPYLWGGTGPAAYDCSGLTSQAWAAAGVPVPRTSQEQWAQLPKVPLSRLRPGDLVVYFPDATHVGLYLGAGLMVNAPHTGAVIRIAPVAALPVLGAVRPSGAG